MIFTVFLPYLVSKLKDIVERNNWNNPRHAFNKKNVPLEKRLKYLIARLLHYALNLFSVASFINLILFFLSHKRRSLAERVLKVDLERIDPNQRRYVDFTYINRLIVWNALGNALSSLLPFLDVSKIKGMFAMSQKLT